MKNRAYWQQRFLALEADQVKKAKNLAKRLEKEWLKTTKEIEKEITSFYSKFAVDNKMDMSTAKAMLSFGEMKEFKWDVEEYISKAKETVLNGNWEKELGNAYAKQRISRLQAIDIQLRERIEELYNEEYVYLKDLAESTYKDTYYKSIFEIDKGFGLGSSFNIIDNRRIEKLLATGWTSDNKTFSDRIWTSKEKLISTLQTELTQNIILGKAPDKLINSIAKTMNTSKNNAARLVMTESAFFYSTAQKDAYGELDVEKYEYLATLDMDTSEICQSMDAQVFDMKDYKVGVTAPPLHPWCRSVMVPYFSYSFGERWARGEDGKSYTVPADMTYEQWRRARGLGSGKDKFYLESTIENIFALDYNDDKEVEATFKEFAKDHVKSDREYAIVVTKNNEAYYVKGGTASVDITLVDNLKGAKVIHNHPDEYGMFGDSFSIEDFKLYFREEIEELQVVSGLGRYKFLSNGYKMTDEKAYNIYKEAKIKVLNKANSIKPMDYEQKSIMEEIILSNPKFTFKEVE